MKKVLLILLLVLGMTVHAQDDCVYQYKATIIDIYDGDTVTAKIDLGFHVSIVEKLRLYGIDTPEIRGEERPEGLISRDRLIEKILHKDIMLHTIKDKKGKYGRYLAILYIDGENINEWLVLEGLAEYRDY